MAIDIAKGAIETAESWVKTAEEMLKVKVYNTSLYSEEMAVEISLKAVMLAFGIQPPKVHNIIESFETNIIDHGILPKKYKEQLKNITRSLLPDLLRTRQISGYTFNFNISKDDMETLAIRYIDTAKNTVKICKEIIYSK